MSVPVTTEKSEPLPPEQTPAASIVHLIAAGVSLVVDMTGPQLPRVVHWGAALGELNAEELATLVIASVPPRVSNTIDSPLPVAVIAEASAGWAGIPGVSGHHDGVDFSPQFIVEERIVHARPELDGGTIRVIAADLELALRLELAIELTPDGLVKLSAVILNAGSTPWVLDTLTLNLPVPTTAQELLDFTGRHLRERSPQRGPFTLGAHVREGRRGRTGADATLLLVAGTPGFGFAEGEVWGLHTGWSGNHTTYAERQNQGVAILGGGELLLPGEIRLAEGERYSTPVVYGSYGRGLDELSSRFHRYLRARPEHRNTRRPVALNTWEAVYFDHSLEKLVALADRAAEVGVERFILDDGWFRHRRNDKAGLGDWYVDETVWPDGLHPIVEHVRSKGMEFGLWFEPEMINVDSDTAREHPEWIMSTGTRLPPESRNQQVIDLSNPAAFDYIRERIGALVEEYSLDYIKWDHNRDLVDAGHPMSRRGGVHDQTLATYRLIDDLRLSYPELEIESCSSGGARSDLGILERTDRIWVSDCIDALERQHNQRWTGLIVPPEMMGAHVGAPTAHTTGRTHALDFRAGTALFGHFGIEWDLTEASEGDLAELASWVSLYKEWREVLHSGTVVRATRADSAHWLHGVVSQDGSEALFAFVALKTGVFAPPGPIQFPGLIDDASYSVEFINPVERHRSRGLPAHPEWAPKVRMISGRALRVFGLQAPALFPESLQLIRVRRTGADA